MESLQGLILLLILPLLVEPQPGCGFSSVLEVLKFSTCNEENAGLSVADTSGDDFKTVKLTKIKQRINGYSIHIKTIHKMKNLFFLFVFASVSGFSQSNQFITKGKAKGLKDSTKLYLRAGGADKNMAFAYVVNETFEIRGFYPENDTVMDVLIFTNDFRHNKTFWIEGSLITFNATKDNFSYAQIAGSPTQLVAEKFYKLSEP